MRVFFACLLLFLSEVNFAQRINQMPDSLRNKIKKSQEVKKEIKEIKSDEALIKEKLVRLALQNPSIVNADAQIRIAELNREKIKTTLLSSVNAGANFNEFVLSKSPVASFYPRYNLGISLPFSTFSKTKFEKQVGDQNIIIANALKDEKMILIRAEVLTRYENYKEKKELVRLQKIFIEDDYSTYLAAQKMYSDGLIKLEDMNRIYQSYINEQSKLVSRERDLNVAIIQLEQMIGTSLNKVISNF